MITYKLAKQLKEAGFPMRNVSVGAGPLGKDQIKIDKWWYYIPTLSELIEACGDYINIFQLTDGWGVVKGKDPIWMEGRNAKGFGELNIIERAVGKAPDVAVAKLYIRLNERA